MKKPSDSGQPTEPPPLAESPSNIFDLHAFGSDVVVHAVGSGFLLLIAFFWTIIIPAYLSVENYGYWQLFLLYSGYIGILHLGFVNGILLRWAGKKLSEVGSEIKRALIFLLLEQVVIIAPLSLGLYFLLDPPFQGIGPMLLVYAFLSNIVQLFLFAAMAVRKFKLLTAINIGRGLAFLLTIILFFNLGYVGYHHVFFAFFSSYLFILLFAVFWFSKYLGGKMPSFSSLLNYGKENTNLGVFILLGTFVSIFLLSIDRLMVSAFFSIEQFAIYAFALTIALAAHTFVGVVAQVFFPHLSATTPQSRTKAYQLAKPAIILSWAAILAVYFPATKIVEFYLPHYVVSLPVLQILLGTIGFGSVIHILHTNYYAVYRKQRQYFLWGITALILSALLNLLAIKVWGTLESVAIATLISFVIWYVINEMSLKSVTSESNKGLWKSLAIVISYLGGFWLASFLVDWFVTQALVYIGFFLLATWLLLGSETRQLVTLVGGWWRNRRG